MLSVTVQAWPFEQMMQDYLLDPFLFGNKYNLVNSDNLWGKYISSDRTNDKEVLASYWYSKTYDEYITDPNTQFLLCLEGYVDKTAKNASFTSYAGEPFLLSVLHLEVSQGTFQCMVCAGIPPRPGVWFVSKEEAVLSQIPYQRHVQSQIPQDNECCP
jgi:hypothetical protein